MRLHGALLLVAVLLLGVLTGEAAVLGVPAKGQDSVLVKGRQPVRGEVPAEGQDPAKGQGPVKGPGAHKPGVCPTTLIRCAMLNPPNRCRSDSECPAARKCCVGPCGLACLEPL